MNALIARVFFSAAIAAGIVAAPLAPANATGTVIVQQRDGTTKTYRDVRIAIEDQAMAITSADKKGTLVLGKAACTEVGELVKCLPYDATLLQGGMKFHIPLKVGGTVWINRSATNQQLPQSSEHLPPHGVLVAVTTIKGTLVSLTGVVDEVQK
jgi:hypothetical protein